MTSMRTLYGRWTSSQTRFVLVAEYWGTGPGSMLAVIKVHAFLNHLTAFSKSFLKRLPGEGLLLRVKMGRTVHTITSTAVKGTPPLPSNSYPGADLVLQHPTAQPMHRQVLQLVGVNHAHPPMVPNTGEPRGRELDHHRRQPMGRIRQQRRAGQSSPPLSFARSTA